RRLVAEHLMEKPPIDSPRDRPRARVAPAHAGGNLRRFFLQLGREGLPDNIGGIGAMMAYYAIPSLFPMLLFTVTLALLVLPDATILQGLGMVTEAMPDATRELVTAQVVALMKAAQAGFAIGGAALALWGASRGAASLSGALNTMYNKRETRP